MIKQSNSALQEERDMIEALEAGGYQPIANEQAEIKRYTQTFRDSDRKSNPLTKH